MSFITQHQAALAAVCGIMINEFIANNPAIQSNSLGHMLVSYVMGFLKSKEK